MPVRTPTSSRAAQEEASAPERRALTLLIEGMALHQIQIDSDMYRRFRSAILRESNRLAELQSEPDLLQNVGTLVREFESYRSESEAALDTRQSQWRHLASMLLHFLGPHYKLDPQGGAWKTITTQLAHAIAADEIEALRARLQNLFEQSEVELAARAASVEDEEDRSEANDNAAGLRGGGAAIEHVRKMISSSRAGYVCLFRLNCLDVVGERFGQEGIQDCLMAVSAFLIESLRKEDSVYHWSEYSLLAVCDRKVREDILSAELNRVLSHNRDFTIQIGNSRIMLRIPIELEIFSISLFETAEDLKKLSAKRGLGDFPLGERAISRGTS